MSIRRLELAPLRLALTPRSEIALSLLVSLVVGLAASTQSIDRSLPLLLIGALVSLVVAPWALLVAAIATMRSINLPSIGEVLTVTDVLILVYLGRRLLVLSRERRLALTPANRWLVWFLAWAWLCTFVGGPQLTPLLRLTVYGLLCIVLAVDDTPGRRVLFGFFVFYALAEVVVSIPQQGSERLTGVLIGDPHQLSVLCMAALAPIVSGTIRFSGRWLAAGVLVLGVLLAQSRGPIIAMAAMMLLPLLRQVDRRKIAVVVCGVLLCGLALYEPATRAFDLNPISRETRERSVERGIRAGLSSPLVGQGWSAPLSSVASSEREALVQPYNLYVSTFAFTGVPGLVLLILFLGSALRSMIGSDRAAVTFTTGMLLLSLTEMLLYAGSLATVLFLVVLGVGQRGSGQGPTAAGHRRPAEEARVEGR